MIETHLPVAIVFTYLIFAVIGTAVSFRNKDWAQPLAVLGAGVATLFSIIAFISFLNEGEIVRYWFGNWQPPVGIEFVYDGLSGFISLVINFVAFIVLWHSGANAKAEFKSKRHVYYSVAMLLMLGFNGMVMTGDLFNLYVFLEISSLASYALIAIGNKNAPFAAFRYLIIGTVGGTLYLLGVGFLYTITGTLNMIDMEAMLPMLMDNNVAIAALVLILGGIGVKAALFPLHGWLPDAYTNASSTSSALIAPIGTKVAAYVLFRVVLYVYGADTFESMIPIDYIIGLLASVGIIYGSVMAIGQKELKKMLAYSSVSQIGYIIMGLSLMNPFGFAGALLHVLNHAFMKACLFLVSGNLRLKLGHTRVFDFDSSVAKKQPWTMFGFTVAAISMVGLPPLAGFFSKWYLAIGTVQNSNWLFLAVILVSSLLNAVYFFRILEKVYTNKDNPADLDLDAVEQDEVGFNGKAPVMILAIGLLVIGLTNAAIVGFLFNIFPG
jgi:multicomponent Na+:H+ antiporter subunit D